MLEHSQTKMSLIKLTLKKNIFMKFIIATLLVLFSATTFAQPSAIKPKTQKSEIKNDQILGALEIKYNLITDTITVVFIVYDKEGYLKKQPGKVVRKVRYYEQRIQAEVESELYFTDSWATIKREDFYDLKQLK